jgi:hypothetical protein
MAESRRKRPRDPAQLAKLMIDIASGEVEDRATTPQKKAKNPAAVALGKIGGLKGGRARAKKMDPKKRREIARRAAAIRWGRQNGNR